MSAIRILCLFGSLTEGYGGYGTPNDNRPYWIQKQQRLQTAFPNMEIDVIEDGVAGATVNSASFGTRLERHLLDPKFDKILILGGKNDLAYPSTSASTVVECSIDLYTTALSRARVLALTVPECEVDSVLLNAKRDRVNKGIMEYQHADYHVFGLKTHIPFHSLSEAEKSKYWLDGLHLTPEGYDWMGGFIGSALVDLFKQEKAKSPGDLSEAKQSE